ncbi:MAG: T9SS type A sorting domain-containing protein, partial [Bacteroidota bacterium]|nr:T9SS type A sorting domain-containing protein [Bacteroidota bacterium]
VKNLNISIYPNPVRDMIQVNGLNDKSSAKVTLADMSGYVWMSTMARNQSYIKFNVSRLKPGNYLINVNDEKGAMKTIQFLKE